MLALSLPHLAPATWKTYTNVRFHYSLCYPEDLLSPQGESANSDGQTFLGKDGAKLIVYGENDVLGEGIQTRLQETAKRLAGSSGKITLQVRKPTWFVVSGKHGDTVFYAKAVYGLEQFKSFEMTYSARQAKLYDPVVQKLASCFHTQ